MKKSTIYVTIVCALGLLLLVGIPFAQEKNDGKENAADANTQRAGKMRAEARAEAAEKIKSAKADLQLKNVTISENCCVKQYWAVLETDGTLIRGRNVVNVIKLGVGQYEVEFTNDMQRGVFVATIGRPGIFTEPPGTISVAVRAGNNNAVWVDTHDTDGKYADRAFHLLVNTDDQ